MNILIIMVIVESLLILGMITQLFRIKKIITRLIQENAVMWEYLKEKEN
ncbi:MAG: hypothetical protein MR639_10205 [Clostridium sp.]|nr:hypothetical protein [Clostridium sp.]MDY5096883.1 hypothetical protein [Clostridium sp.]